MKEKPKTKLRKDKIFVVANLAIIILIALFYGARLIYYYRLEHPKTVAKRTLISVLSSDANVVFDGEGLYKNNDNSYTFKGKNLNNYVSYSGRLWRIVGINQDSSVRLITDDIDTTLVWGLDNDYETSYAITWLNNKEGNLYSSLNNSNTYLTQGNYCIDIIDEEFNICEKTHRSLIGLLSYEEYEAATGEKSYLNNGKYWWTINGTIDNDVWYVTAAGKMGNASHNKTSYNAYGIRPVINVKGSVTLTSGNGSLEEPYTFDQVKSETLSEIGVGLYLKYNDYIWRVVSNKAEGIKVAMNGFIKEGNKEVESIFAKKTNKFSPSNTEIGTYLNKTFYNSLKNKDLILKGKWGIGQYNSFVEYDYTNIHYSDVEAHVGLLAIGELFINDFENVFLITGESSIIGTVYKLTDEGTLYSEQTTSASKIRPALYLDPKTSIKSGKGTIEDPFIIE